MQKKAKKILWGEVYENFALQTEGQRDRAGYTGPPKAMAGPKMLKKFSFTPTRSFSELLVPTQFFWGGGNYVITQRNEKLVTDRRTDHPTQRRSPTDKLQ